MRPMQCNGFIGAQKRFAMPGNMDRLVLRHLGSSIPRDRSLSHHTCSKKGNSLKAILTALWQLSGRIEASL